MDDAVRSEGTQARELGERSGSHPVGGAPGPGDRAPKPGPAASPTARPMSAGPPVLEDSRRLRPPTLRVTLLVVSAAVVALLLFIGRDALGPFVVGLLLVYLLDPLVERIARTGLPRWFAIIVVYALVVIVVGTALNLTLSPLIDQLRAFFTDLPGFLNRIQELYRGLDMPPQVRRAIDEWAAQVANGQGLNPGVLLPVVNITAGLVGAIFGYLIIPVWAFYLLKDRRELTDAFDRSLPGEWRDDVWAVVRIVERVFSQWVRAQLLLGLVVAVATFGGLLVLGATVDPIFGRFALLLALIAGVLELLPIIGPIIAAVPAILLAATAGVQATIAALLLYIIVQQLENNILVPKIQGDAVQLHPSAVMFALVIGGAIGGLLGAILALPVTAAGRDVYRYLFRRLSPGGGGATQESSESAVRAVLGDAATPTDVVPPDTPTSLPADA